MPKVKLTSAEWQIVLYLLDHGHHDVTGPIIKSINDQLDEQEY